MTRKRYLALNALAMLIANIIDKLVLFIGVVYLMQYLAPTLESTYYLVSAFGALIGLNFQDGMVAVSIRRISTNLKNGPHELGTLYLASFLLSIALGAISVIAAFLYARTQFTDPGLQGEFILSALALTGTYLLGYTASSAGAGFKAYEKLYLEAIMFVLQAVMSAGIYIYGSKHGWPLSGFFIGIFAITTIYVVVTNIVFFIFIVKPKFHVDTRAAWSLFTESVGLGYATLLRTLQDRMHPFFIDRLAGHDLITQFASPNQFLTNFKFIPFSIRPALFPTLARKATMESDAFQVFSTTLMKFLYLIALPLVILLSVARYEILPLVTERSPAFKEIYALALNVYPFVAWSVALSFPSQVLRSLFVALKHPEFEFRTVLAGVGFLAVVDLTLIPLIGVMGAAYGALACEIIILSYGLWLLKKVGRPLNVMKFLLLPTLCGIITNSLAEYLYNYHWLIGIATVVIIFPGLVLTLRVVSPQEWAIIREIIRPVPSANRES